MTLQRWRNFCAFYLDASFEPCPVSPVAINQWYVRHPRLHSEGTNSKLGFYETHFIMHLSFLWRDWVPQKIHKQLIICGLIRFERKAAAAEQKHIYYEGEYCEAEELPNGFTKIRWESDLWKFDVFGWCLNAVTNMTCRNGQKGIWSPKWKTKGTKIGK